MTKTVALLLGGLSAAAAFVALDAGFVTESRMRENCTYGLTRDIPLMTALSLACLWVVN